MNSKPKVLIYDVESAPILGYVWKHYEANVLRTIEDGYLLSVAYKWYGDKDVTFTRKAARKGDDKALIKEIWRLFDEADIVVAHNGDKFDQKMANTRFLHYGLGLPSPYSQVDTLKEARRHFRLAANSLNEIGRFLQLGAKVQHTGIDLWMRCMDNDAEAWAVMEAYNIQDVNLLEKVWLAFRPYTGHPGVASPATNMQQWSGLNTCTKIGCGSTNIHKRGVKRTKANAFQVYQCNTCGGYSRALLADDGRLR